MDDLVKSLTTSGENDDDDAGEWLVTYADMVTLLLTFFVLLVALANFDTPTRASSRWRRSRRRIARARVVVR